MRLSPAVLAAQLAEVVDRSGWDFSPVHDARDPVPWDWGALVSLYLHPTDHVLDVGTGGGEHFLALASQFARGLGGDVDPAMIATAQHNRAVVGVTNVAFDLLDAHALALADASFDVVLNRHCSVDVAETLRVLRPGGRFITQQVADRNMECLLSAFGWTSESFGPDWWQPVATLASAFEAAGAFVESCSTYNVCYWFLDIPSLLFWLKAVPLPEPFDPDRHWEAVNRVLATCATPRGIETNEHRDLLIVRKL